MQSAVPRDFLQTPGNYYLSLTIGEIQRLKKFTVKKLLQFLKVLTAKLSIFKNKRTSHQEILKSLQIAVLLQNKID